MSFFKRLFGGKQDTRPEVKDRTVHNLKIGDIVTYDLQDYEVVGKLSYNDHGFKWSAYQLQGVQEVIWLGVEMDDELELGIYKKSTLKLQEPLPKEIEYEGTTYYLDETGSAIVKGEGRSQNVDGVKCKYAEYYDEDDEKALSVEIWGGDVEASTGYSIEEYELKIIAGSH
ncbi:hypothetical protein KP77_13460 [Jeotgalibacillus alimentarius]|uniref:DUF4178 domain-containing protein n=2 Tax=Jeotgalibacillus TaxID=157226 RepID=A0A0C2W273_9BACL|nr:MULTISPECIES: DUF4178 domain-containing protein [Jeotgalibacillus]KIL50726.1 hypothetical protein KP77_13460 [Jeotgalibacillus alimentarius]MBM7580364.1 hypothetical protein [Jeotgalibacillus terrae]